MSAAPGNRAPAAPLQPAMSRPRAAAVAWLVALAILPAAASLPACLRADAGGLCQVDGDCAGGEVCTRLGECAEAGRTLRLVIRWTVNGERPSPRSPAVCGDITELEVVFLEGDTGGDSFRPVPCEIGRVVFDLLPPRIDGVLVLAYDGSGSLVARARRALEPAGETAIDIDLDR
ncbi:MAG TPA: hypothetical protein VKZ63_00895 [Kofleriaceae bacterium]|nr:hypothetical protein [Kofleriaceae bacterium]